MNPVTATTIDVRSIAPRERHALIFSCFDALAPGQAIELVNDHDPRPLQGQFAQLRDGRFDWSYLEAGPERWRVQITKVGAATAVATADATGSCCSGGACCG